MNTDNETTHRKPVYKNPWFLLIILIILLSFFGWVSLQLLYPTTSPMNTLSYFMYSKEHPHIPMTQQTIAFLPYWRIPDAQYTQFNLLSEINYFSLTITKDGTFDTITGNQTEPGWYQWNSQTIKDLIAKTQITGGKFTVTVATQRNTTIESLMSNKK